jgi:hypothetical protein
MLLIRGFTSLSFVGVSELCSMHNLNASKVHNFFQIYFQNPKKESIAQRVAGVWRAQA